MIDMEHRDIFKVIDKTGLRISFVEYQAGPDKPIVTLLPMLHAADKAFYTETKYTKYTGDVVLIEGAAPSWLLSLMLRFQKVLAKFFSLNAQAGTGEAKSKSTQSTSGWHRPTPDAPREWGKTLNACGNDECTDHLRYMRFVWADLDRAASKQALKQIGWLDRMRAFGFFLLCPFMLPFYFKKDDRDDLIDKLSDSWTTRDSGSSFKFLDSMNTYIFDARDDYLEMCLRRELDNPENAGKRILVEYGGAHMARLHRILMQSYGLLVVSRRSILALAREPNAQKEMPDRSYGSSKDFYIEVQAKRVQDAEDKRLAEIARLQAANREERAAKRAEKFTRMIKINAQ